MGEGNASDEDEEIKKQHLVAATTAVFILRSAEVCDIVPDGEAASLFACPVDFKFPHIQLVRYIL